MLDVDNEENLRVIEKSLRLSGAYLLSNWASNNKILEETGKDIKLEADKIAEAIILESLTSCSDYSILSEEKGWVGQFDSETPYWLIDPLDGSYNYKNKIPICATVIALCQGNHVVMGGIYDFLGDKMYLGSEANGSSLNGQPISVSKTREMSQAGLATGLPLHSDFSEEGMAQLASDFVYWKKVRMIGSAACSLTMVAEGILDCYKEKGILWWDVAAGIAIARGAGGKAIIDGDPLKDKSLTVTVTNGIINLC